MAFSWKSYTGSVPSTAVHAGVDSIGESYVGRVSVEGVYYVGLLRSGEVQIKICIKNTVETLTANLEILCSNIEPSNFQWVPKGAPATGSHNIDEDVFQIVRTIIDDKVCVGIREDGFAAYIANGDEAVNPRAFDILYCRVL